MKPYPEWLHILSWLYLGLCTCIAVWMIFDFLHGHRQKMWIMHLVWPITAMYFGPVAVWMYLRTLPVSTVSSSHPDEQTVRNMEKMEATREQVSIAVFHCGAGCTLGDVIGESVLLVLGGTALTFIGGSDFATKLVVDFLLAYVFGIFFQYFTMVPMRGLTPGKGILQSMRADTVSIVAFEVGMFAWMALTRFVFFPEPTRIHPAMAVFWFMMQIAMVIGFATSYPANWWLLRKGWKEKMPTYPSEQVMKRHELPPRAA
jgi:hypothetical protein